MPPASGSPRELLWYHQIRRENRHLLEQINKQQVDLDKVRSQSSADQKQREQVQQLLLDLETKQATATERRREDFEREKEILKRIGRLEESVEMLRRAHDSQPMVTGAGSQWQVLEQRLDMLEQRQTTVSGQDMQQLNLRPGTLSRAINTPIKDPITIVSPHVNHGNNGNRVTEGGTDVRQVSAAEQVREGKGKEKMQAERETSRERRSDFVQKKRRPGDRRIPFRPTPADLGW
ncbi:unnamed protein product [Aureobasidium uvarum]|uniref:Uncharacterized protein n=1 Tax=Aureobasidium uvarum TaxID=2773716 RepID=A0A9N8KUM9_9PEZI|nr:unnamed protein product [Aureobasidium uvarum]